MRWPLTDSGKQCRRNISLITCLIFFLVSGLCSCGTVEQCQTVNVVSLLSTHQNGRVVTMLTQARWEEITTWSDQRGRKIEAALSELRANAALLDQLMGWLTAAEANLGAQAHEILPDNLPIIEQLLQDHQVCALHSLNTWLLHFSVLMRRLQQTCLLVAGRRESAGTRSRGPLCWWDVTSKWLNPRCIYLP